MHRRVEQVIINGFRAADGTRKTGNACRMLRTAAGKSQGQALVELALATPMLFLLIALAFNFGGWLYAWVQVGNAARAAANYGVLGSASAGFPGTPSSTQLLNLINADLASLPNTSSSNPAIAVCQNNNGTVTAITGTCSSPPADPEAPLYFTVTVDITYTYTSFFTGTRFLGYNLTVLPSTIHRRVVMRYM
jgi:Flp pilus assembly protein TadG